MKNAVANIDKFYAVNVSCTVLHVLDSTLHGAAIYVSNSNYSMHSIVVERSNATFTALNVFRNSYYNKSAIYGLNSLMTFSALECTENTVKMSGTEVYKGDNKEMYGIDYVDGKTYPIFP